MLPVLLISHGSMAEGVKHAVSMIADASMVETLSLMPEANPEEFRAQIQAKLDEMDTENGVVIFVDLLGGTPGNQAAYFCTPEHKAEVITGMNLPMVLEFVIRNQFGEVDLEEVLATGQAGITHLNKLLGQ